VIEQARAGSQKASIGRPKLGTGLKALGAFMQAVHRDAHPQRVGQLFEPRRDGHRRGSLGELSEREAAPTKIRGHCSVRGVRGQAGS
jgi:hypothetical protein